MFFDTLPFLGFWGACWLVYQFTPKQWRWMLLLMASLIFYATLNAPLLLMAIGGVALSSFYFGAAISREGDEARKRRMLWTGIGVNLLILCGIKYLRYIVGKWNPEVLIEGGESSWFVTIGVSYFTLQAVSYLADIYLEKAESEPHFGRFFLYLSFFPKLMQGPIERAGDLLPQLRKPYEFNYSNMRSGLLLFAWGLFKKEAVANRLAIYVNTVYGDVHSYQGITLIMATYMYAIQIFADFSGYTDMALGVARIFNIKLTQNFNGPYLAASVADFWRRWHISFSRWIFDYIFKPLQMQWRNMQNCGAAAALLVTFLFSGLWHGVSWCFVVWGLLHGIYLVAGVYYKPWQSRLNKALGIKQHPLRKIMQTVITFNLIAFSWIFFRADSLEDAWYVVTHLFSGIPEYVVALVTNISHLGQQKAIVDPILLQKTLPVFLLMLLAVMIMLIVSLVKQHLRLFERPVWIRWSLYYLLICAIALLSVYDDVGFVYFQF
jgi:alginate O-acetyltransferase complex protein AlgI